MTPSERERMNELCREIQDEKDQVKFTLLIEQLNELLSDKRVRLEKNERRI